MPSTIQAAFVLICFLLPGFIISKLVQILSTSRKVELHEFVLIALSGSCISHLFIYPFYKQEYYLAVKLALDPKLLSKISAEASLTPIVLSVFIIPLLVGSMLGILHRIRAQNILLASLFWCLKRVFGHRYS